jgi:hypothetical protein
MRGRDAASPIERTGYEITKQDVASSQLATAIWLWANEWDPISIHVLASAAAEIIRVLRRAKGGLPMRSEILDALASEFTEEVENFFKASFNFMKHGTKDYNAVLRFNPNESEWVIYHACVDYLATFGIAPPEALFFLVYMTEQWPWLIRQETADPVRALREQARGKAEGGKVARQDVARSLLNLHQFAAHLRNIGEHDHPLLRQSLTSPR